MHLPFFGADPDINISTSMGPFTDEGLYSANIRNYISQNTFDFEKSDVPVKAPLFSVLFYFPFLLFGSKLIVARVSVAAISFLILISTLRTLNIKPLGALLIIPSILLQYHLFHFTHYALSEILAVMLTFFSLVLFGKKINEKKFRAAGVLSSLIIFIVLLLKFNFVYLIPLIPLLSLFLWITTKEKKFKSTFVASTLSLLFLSALYFFFFILPHKELFFNVLKSQSQNKFVSISQLPGNIYLLVKYFFSGVLLPVSISFTVALILLFPFKEKIKTKDRAALIPALLIWLILESHKLSMSYLPTRYFIPLIFAMMIFSAIVFSTAFANGGKTLRAAIILLSAAFLTTNIFFYVKSYNRREYKLLSLSKKISRLHLENETALGNWSSSITWNSAIRTLPFIPDGFSDSLILQKEKPRFIALWNNRAEIEAFEKINNINLLNISDSIWHEKIGRFEVGIFWLPEKHE